MCPFLSFPTRAGRRWGSAVNRGLQLTSRGARWVPGKGLMHCTHRMPLLLSPSGRVPLRPCFVGEAAEAQRLRYVFRISTHERQNQDSTPGSRAPEFCA